MLARGPSVRDIEDAFKDESGRLLLSKTAVSELREGDLQESHDVALRDLENETRMPPGFLRLETLTLEGAK
jgi:hypothetical protein